jgi:hypothetical protein
MPSAPDNAPRNVLPDLIIPLLAFGFTVYYLTTITEVPWIAQASAVFVSALLFLALAAYAVRTVARVRAGRERIAFTHLVSNAPTQVKRILLLGLTIGYVLLIGQLGFTATTFLFIFTGIVLLSSLANWKRAALLAAACALSGYVIFIYLFATRFPKGWIEYGLATLFAHAS